MRICFVISSLSSGGAERVVTVLANGLAARNHLVTIVKLDSPNATPFYEVDSSIQIISLDVMHPSTSFFQAAAANVKRIFKLRKALLRHSPDGVISFMGETNVLTLMANLGTNLDIIVSDRNNPPEQERSVIWESLQHLLYGNAYRIVVQTNGARQELPQRLRNNAFIIPNPVPLPKKYDSSRQHQIVCVASLTRQKDHITLLKAFAKIVASYPDWVLVCYGDGPLRSQLEELRDSLGLSEQVLLPGKTTAVYERLAEASIFVLPSLFEGFPNALCEAMASGLPAIATDCPHGPADIIQDGKNGLLVPVGDDAALAQALTTLMSNKAQREYLGRHASEITSRFAVDNVLDMWEDLINLKR